MYCLLCVFDNYYFYGLTDMVYLVCDAFEYVDNLFELDYLYCIGIVFEQFDGEILKHFVGLALYLVQFVAIFLYFACFFLSECNSPIALCIYCVPSSTIWAISSAARGICFGL